MTVPMVSTPGGNDVEIHYKGIIDFDGQLYSSVIEGIPRGGHVTTQTPSVYFSGFVAG